MKDGGLRTGDWGRRLATFAIVVLIACFGMRTARAEDTPETPPAPVKCAVEAQVFQLFAGSTIEACAVTKGDEGTPRADDEYAVDLHMADGTRIAADLTRGGKLLATRTYNPDGSKVENVFGGESGHDVIEHTKIHPHIDALESQGKGMALLFWCFAAACVGGALFVVTRKNLIAAVMGMVGSFLGIAAIYMMLYAHFLAVVQMLVYAGAIMVLFVFVIMILNRPEDEPVPQAGRAGKTLGALAITYLVGRLALMLIHVKAPAAALVAPGITPEGHDWGTVKAVGTDLFNGGLFPFEAISILLLVAVVGAIAIARPLHEKDPADDKDHFTDEKGAP